MKKVILCVFVLMLAAVVGNAQPSHYLYVAGGRVPSAAEPNLDIIEDAVHDEINVMSVLVADVNVGAKTVTNWRRAGLLPTNHPVSNGILHWSYLHDGVNVYNNRLYVGPGAWNGTGPVGADFVAYADIQANGQLGTFQTSAILPSPPTQQRIAATAIVEVNGIPYYYIMGGNSDEGTTSRILYATIDQTTGALGAWNVTSVALPSNEWFHSAVSDGGVMIVSDGNVNSSAAQVWTAPIAVGGDIVSAFSAATYTAAFNARWDHTTLKATSGANSYVYLIAGTATGLGTIDRVDFASVSAGTLGTWGTTNSIPAVRRRLAGAAVNDMLVVPGGSSTTGFVDGTSTVFTCLMFALAV